MLKYLVLAVLAVGLGVVGWWMLAPAPPGSGGAQREVVVPQLSAAAQRGKAAFDGNCARCHGENAAGTGNGPPLVHDYYNPGHHADGAFHVAVTRGVRQHHWRFGNMPPQPHVTDQQTRMIVRYVRELQEANGIQFEPH
ncbi:MAG: cytochrome c [Alphaproteobacteria bacterium]|nr:cytochrome c [Alphaproteobacteria bacterium]